MSEIAIIGSGSAGTLAAWRLRQLLGEKARITVFEREEQIGGRAHHIEFAGELVELGGTLIHTDNRRLVELARDVSVELKERRVSQPAGDGSLLVWDGRKAVFQAPLDGVGLPLALVRRYGPVNLLKLQKLAKQAKAAWNSVYRLQDAGRRFTTPEELITAAGLTPYIETSLTQLAERRGIKGRLIDQFATGVLRDMYNQTADVIALAGLVGLAGAGLAGGSLVAAPRGNATLFARALETAGAEVRLGSRVDGIVQREGKTLVAVAGAEPEAFDAVIVAAPLELAGIDLAGTDGPIAADVGRRFQDVHTTVVAGQADPAFFGAKAAPGDVLTTNDPSAQFKAFGQTGHSRALDVPIWKFFSAEPISEELLGQIFSEVKEVHRHLWRAYPVLRPSPKFLPFRLAPGLYQVNSFESAVSTLETEGAVGWSVADLVARDLRAPTSEP
ncbi:MAG: FAD-dependent oxidoreductase [Bifidobacteriaceae bacterium]|jgi:glycine/D-amino acid oxidase-like deaminating enzyme|nr:FAD-dependent oxidoreductase [Bifidobacteriaceae bacterium]